MEWMASLLPTFGLIFAIIDPFGYVPIFLSMTANDSQAQRERMVRRAAFAAFVILGSFTVLGRFILQFFDISIPALQISGGLILLVVGFEMLNMFPVGQKLTHSEEEEGVQKDDISIVPLAIPMLSGPASIATVVVLAASDESWGNYGLILFSILVTLLVTYFVLRFAGHILNIVGRTGLNVVTRIMGLLMCAMAIQFLINGYRAIHAG